MPATLHSPRHIGRSLACALASLAALVAIAPSLAHGQESPWSVHVEGLFLSPDDHRGIARLGDEAPLEAEYGIDGDGVGFTLGLAYRLTSRFGVTFDVGSVDLDGVVRAETGGEVIEDTESAAFEMYLAGVEWHLVPDRRLDATIGAFVAMTKLDDLVFLTEHGRRDKLTFDDDVGIGVSIGIEWPFTRAGGWRAKARARYLKTILESDSGSRDLDLDPLMVSAGIAYRF